MKILITFCIFLCTQFVQAQFIDTKLKNVNNGLISNNIQAGFVDTDANLWLGSRAGLVLRSGTSFKNVPEAAKYKFNNVFDFCQDTEKGMWVAGFGQGILYFNNKTSRLINIKSGLINDHVRTLFYHNNKVYAGTSNGVSIISSKDFSVKNPDFEQHPDYFFNVTSFFAINNNVYATVLNDGIFLVTPQKLIQVSTLKKAFSSFVFNNRLFIGTQNNLFELDALTFEKMCTFNVSSVHKFLLVNKQMYLISSGIVENKGGIFKFENNDFIDITTEFHIPFTDFKSIAFDRQNQLLYLGTQNNGLAEINLYAPVYHQKNLKEVAVIAVDDQKEYVFHNNGFSIYQNSIEIKHLSKKAFKNFQQQNPSKYSKQAVIQNHFYPIDYSTTTEKIIFYSSQIHKNNLWVNTNIGIFKLTLNGEITNYYPVHVYYFTFFHNNLIAAVPYAGVRIFTDIDQFNYDYFHDWKNPNVPAEIVSIAQTEKAVYFASALSGLYEYKNGKFRSFLFDKSFTEPKIKRICTTKTGDLVVVTDYNDVYILDVSQAKLKIKKQISYPKIKGSTTNFVHEINGVLYIGTNLGLNVFKENTYFFIDKAQGFTNYNSLCATDDSKRLLVGTEEGYFVLNNDYFVQKRAFANTLSITDLFVNNNKISNEEYGNNQIILPFNENNLRLHFQVNNAKYPDKLQFKFRLKPSELWQELTTENHLILNYLNAGEYSIELQIYNEDTGTVSIQKLINITIKPPFYYTWWFLTACILLISGLTYAAYRIRINYLNQKQKQKLAVIELQNQQEKKELIFDKQLADVKLQALKSQMNSHFLFNVLSSIQYYIICKDVDNALYYLERFSALVRTTLEYSDKKDIAIYDEIAYLKQYIEIENLRAEHAIVLTENIAEDIDVTQIKIVPLLL
ncbi:histidine kinase [Flavobacterium sp. CBA20B-1]|uniref:histidine kinase n=1 Tax=unclassified Flavobacterium TaxID=196869 RepID=UPI002224E408|nr:MULTISPECIES: histidine kinase [unclassified Flavobacterium]WCM42109.1 histidine kinase [Flavobacterium sp. CBA20B-1]